MKFKKGDFFVMTSGMGEDLIAVGLVKKQFSRHEMLKQYHDTLGTRKFDAAKFSYFLEEIGCVKIVKCWEWFLSSDKDSRLFNAEQRDEEE